MFRWLLTAVCFGAVATSVTGQEPPTVPVIPPLQETGLSPPPRVSLPPAPAQDRSINPQAERPSVLCYTPGDGLTVSLLSGTRTLKLFGQFSAIGVVSTDRPFSAGMPLLLLPPSAFGLNTNTFDLHARQTSFGAVFSGPEVMGFTPGHRSSGSSRTTT